MKEKRLQLLFSQLEYFDDMFTETYIYACQILFDERFIYIEWEKNYIMKEYILLEIGNTSYDHFMCRLLMDSLPLLKGGNDITVDQYYTFLEINDFKNKHLVIDELISLLKTLNKGLNIEDMWHIIKKYTA